MSTALVRITSGLGGFERSSWVVNAYLLTYTGEWKDNQEEISLWKGYTNICGFQAS